MFTSDIFQSAPTVAAGHVYGVAFDDGGHLPADIVIIVLVGFPHGAFDHPVARPVLAQHLGRFWWAPFGLAYLSRPGLARVPDGPAQATTRHH